MRVQLKWFRPDSILKYDTHSPDYTWLFSKNISGNQAGDMGICWKRDQGALQSFIQDGTNTYSTYTEQEIWQPRWTHVAFTWNANDSMRTFINGVMQPDVQPDGIPEGETSPAVEGGPQAIIIGSGSQDLLYGRYETFRGQQMKSVFLPLLDILQILPLIHLLMFQMHIQ